SWSGHNYLDRTGRLSSLCRKNVDPEQLAVRSNRVCNGLLIVEFLAFSPERAGTEYSIVTLGAHPVPSRSLTVEFRLIRHAGYDELARRSEVRRVCDVRCNVFKKSIKFTLNRRLYRACCNDRHCSQANENRRDDCGQCASFNRAHLIFFGRAAGSHRHEPSQSSRGRFSCATDL